MPDIYPSVPDYQVEFFTDQPPHQDLVFIFVFNESDKLRKQLERFPPPEERTYDIMIGDDGSTDGSSDPDILKAYGVRGTVTLEHNSGLSTNIRAGLHWFTQDTAYASVIMMNGNNKDDPGAIPRFQEKLHSGLDYVQGSRFMPGGSMRNTPMLRHYAIRLMHAPLFSLAAGSWMTDTTNGYRAFSRTFLTSDQVFPFQSCFRAYEIEQYLAWKAIRLNYRHDEINVARDYPTPAARGKGASISKIKPGTGYWLMLKPLIALLLRWYK
ncbi:MAG: glycosyltransferase family 2 protein [Verrucomicrobiota bacterium]